MMASDYELEIESTLPLEWRLCQWQSTWSLRAHGGRSMSAVALAGRPSGLSSGPRPQAGRAPFGFDRDGPWARRPDVARRMQRGLGQRSLIEGRYAASPARPRSLGRSMLDRGHQPLGTLVGTAIRRPAGGHGVSTSSTAAGVLTGALACLPPAALTLESLGEQTQCAYSASAIHD